MTQGTDFITVDEHQLSEADVRLHYQTDTGRLRISFLSPSDSSDALRRASAPGRDEVHVWTTVITTEADQGETRSLLSHDERQQADRFISGAARNEFIFCRSWLRQLIGACLGTDPAKLAFEHQPLGKPLLAGPERKSGLRFNLSHSSGMAAIALAMDQEVGIDLEWIHGLEDWEPVAERILSRTEHRELGSLPVGLRRDAFFRAWTRKEAYLKATGEGLSDSLSEIQTVLDPSVSPSLLALPGGRVASQWLVHDFSPLPGYVGAVVVERGDNSLTQ